MTPSLKRALVAFIDAGTLEGKRRLLERNVGLRSPTVCAVLCEQAEEELRLGNQKDAEVYLTNLCLILAVNSSGGKVNEKN